MNKLLTVQKIPIINKANAEQEFEWKVQDAVYTIERYAGLKKDQKLWKAAILKLQEKQDILSSILVEKLSENVTEIIGSFETYSYSAKEDFVLNDAVQVKKGQELHYVLGVVLQPETVDGTITDKSMGDIYSEDEVRKAAHQFMLKYKGKGNDFMHDGKDNDSLAIVESYIAQTDMNLNGQQIKKGTWMMGTLVLDNQIWKLIKGGKITGYSIGGVARGKFE